MPQGPADSRSAPEPTSLLKAKGHTEHASEVVEACAVELSTVNTSLKKEIEEGGATTAIRRALDQSENVEIKVEECADELVSVNAALAEGIRERRGLHHELAKTNDALAESRRQAKKARSDAMHDALTGLPNFTLFKDRLELALIQAHRHHWRAAVMFIDLDRFKEVNDTHGHDIGDLCLKEIADRLESVTRGDDTVCRRSGDEFQFLMIEAGEKPVIAAVAAKLRAIISGACDVATVPVSVTASIGLAVFPDDGRSAQELLEKADTAMYASKRQGTGPVFWSELDAAQAIEQPSR
jgi:diguanylate cyclase (GGDEF)-like protein